MRLSGVKRSEVVQSYFGPITAWSLFSFILFGSCAIPQHRQTSSDRGQISEHAMVVSAHPLASQIGTNIMHQGGNAWDAAISVQFALAVVYPVAGNIGGGGFAVFRSHHGETGTLDFREKAPLAADKSMYLDADGDVLAGQQSLLGHRAAGVPGTVDGMIQLHQRYGTLSWAQLIDPSIDLARKGYRLNDRDAHNLNNAQDFFTLVNRDSNIFMKSSGWRSGDHLQQYDLARTLERIRDQGRHGFYGGETARLIQEEMKRGKGLITEVDLQRYRAQWRVPVEGSYRGYHVISMPPPSSGGVALLQLLKGVEPFPLARYGPNSVKAIHVMTEVEKHVYADRATYLGDSDFYDVPLTKLLSASYLNERFANIKLSKTIPSQEIKEGKVSTIESIQTTHFSVVDPAGNAVAITTTLNSYFGCKVLVPGAGFFLNNEMDDFSIKTGEPNQFGLVGADANAILPEKRMLSSMTPTIVEKDGVLHLVLGSPGGSTIITSVFQTILNVIDHDMSLQEAVNAYRVHHQWLPDRLLIESKALDHRTKRRLARRGYEIESRSAIGSVNAIMIHNGKLVGVGDRRGNNSAVGF